MLLCSIAPLVVKTVLNAGAHFRNRPMTAFVEATAGMMRLVTP